jgi:hypothetical protein
LNFDITQKQPDTRLEETRVIKNLFDKFPHMRALGRITGRHACNAAGGKGNNESHQELA